MRILHSRRSARFAIFTAALMSAALIGQGIASAAPVASLGGAERGDGPSAQIVGGNDRIVGGNATTNGKYPWQALVLAESDEGTGLCGGSVIHPYIVITAAHCLIGEDGTPHPGLSAATVEVHLGRTQLFSGGEAHGGFEIYWHPEYDPAANEPTSSINDVAFISLDVPTEFPRILLAGPTERALWTAGRAAYVSGWGTTAEGGDVSEVLKEALVPIIDDGTCAQPAINGSFGFVASVMVCAGYLAGGTDSCQGDSGGPLQSPFDGGGFRLTGIVSWGIGCARVNKPGVYTRIADEPLRSFTQAAIDFIEEDEGIPDEFTGIQVIGSGARPPGCAAAEAAIAPASLLASEKAAPVPGARKAAQKARKGLKKATKAKKSAQRAKKNARTKAQLGKATKRLAKATKKLKKARRKAGAANRKLAKVSAASTQANEAAAASLANKVAVCGA
jgi:Trypsin